MKKRCPTCGKTKALEHWPRNAASPSGYGGRCKKCHARQMKERREANRDRDREIRRQSYRRHAERIIAEHAAARKADVAAARVRDRKSYETRTSTLEGLAYFRSHQERWKRENPEKHAEVSRAATRRWKQANPERVAANERAWREANPEKYRAMQHRHHAKRKALLRGETGIRIENIDRALVLERDDGLCGICCAPVDPADWHMDHVVPLARGGEHTYENVQVAHPGCNMRKHARLPEGAAVE